MGLRSAEEFGKDLPSEIEGEGNEEEGEEQEDRGLMGLCPALPNDPPTLCPSSLGLPPLDPISSIFSNGILKLGVPGASATVPDNIPSVLPSANFTSSSNKGILDPPCVAAATCPPSAIWPCGCQSLCRSESGLEDVSGEEARTTGMLAPERILGGLCCC